MEEGVVIVTCREFTLSSENLKKLLDYINDFIGFDVEAKRLNEVTMSYDLKLLRTLDDTKSTLTSRKTSISIKLNFVIKAEVFLKREFTYAFS